jgi:hypothetical protein
MKLLYKKLPSGEMVLEEVNPYDKLKDSSLDTGSRINQSWLHFIPKTYHTDSILEDGKEYDMEEFEIITQALTSIGYIDKQPNMSDLLITKEIARLKHQTKPAMSQETALEMLEALKKAKHLIDKHFIIPGEQASDFLDDMDDAISKAEEELKKK